MKYIVIVGSGSEAKPLRNQKEEVIKFSTCDSATERADRHDAPTQVLAVIDED